MRLWRGSARTNGARKIVTKTRGAARRQPYRKPALESFEKRWMLTAYVVDGLRGNDSNPGTAELPFRTISRGVSQAASSEGADLVEILAGTYAEYVNIVDTSGPVTLRGIPSLTAGVSITGGGTLIGILQASDVTIENLTLSNAYTGVAVFNNAGSPNLTLRNLVVANNNGTGVWVDGAAEITVQGGVFERNETALYAEDIQDLQIEDADFSSNRGVGVHVVRGHDVNISGGHFDANNYGGILLLTVNDVSIMDATSSDNSDTGIDIRTAHNVTVSGGNYDRNRWEGIFLAVVNDVIISGVTASDNQDNGIDIRAAHDVGVADATVLRNVPAPGYSTVDGFYLDQANSVTLNGGEYSQNSNNGFGLNAVAQSISVSGVRADSNKWNGASMVGSAPVTLVDGSFSNNVMRGVNVNGASGTTVRNVVATGNGTTSKTDFSGGGALLVQSNSSNPVVIENLVARNNLSLKNGGAVSVTAPAVVTISGSLIESNSSRFGQAIGGGLYFGSQTANVLITDSTISSNEALNGGGISAVGALTLRRVSLENNFAVTFGGAVHMPSGGLAIDSSTVAGNRVGSQGTSSHGGGIFVGTVVGQIVNSTISGNTTNGDGGGIEARLGSGSFTITHTTITNNTAANGGGLHVASGSPRLVASLVAGNHANIGVDVYGTVTSGGMNVIGDGLNGRGFLAGTSYADLVGTSSAPIAPLLGPLQNNGGSTKTHALLAGSPAIDRASISDALYDQRGIERNMDGNGDGSALPDTGAFEVWRPDSPPSLSAESYGVFVKEGQTATNSGRFSDLDENQVVTISSSVGMIVQQQTGQEGTWAWSFDSDDGPAQSQSVSIFATDDNGRTSEISFWLGVENLPPTASLSNSGPVNEGGSATVTFSNATDPSDADTAAGFTYAFDFNNDGTFDLTGPNASANVPAALTAEGDATLKVRARVIDINGGFSEYLTTLVITNVAPAATFSNSGPVDEGNAATVSFTDADDASDIDVAAGFTYSVDFDNDGTFDTSGPSATVNVPASFVAEGDRSLIIRGRISDVDGGYRDYITTLVVNNVAPTALFSNSGPVDEGSAANVSFTEVYDASPIDSNAGFTYAFDLDNDGVFDVSGPSPTARVPANLLAEGFAALEIHGRIIDEDGGFSDYSTTLFVLNAAPTASFSNSGPVDEGGTATVSFTDQNDASQADLAAGFSYAFDFDNDGNFDLGGPNATANIPANLLAEGTASLIIRGRISDVDGSFTDYVTTLIVNNAPPTAIFSNSGPVDEGGTATVSFSHANDASAVDRLAGFTYSFDWNNDGVFEVTGANISASVPDNRLAEGDASLTIRGRISDVDGGFTDYLTTLTVNNVAPTANFNNSGPTSEGGTATVSFSNATDASADDRAAGFTYLFDWNNDGVFEVTGSSDTASVPVNLLAEGDATFTIRGRISDVDGEFTDYLTTLTINNAAPTADFRNSGPVGEGGAATVSFSNANDASAVDRAAGFSYSFDWNNDGAFEVTGTNPTANVPAALLANGNASLTIRGRISDVDGGSTVYLTTLSVTNATPVITQLTPSSNTPPQGTSLSLSGKFSDAGIQDTHSASVDWGDGISGQPLSVTESGGTGTLSGSHVYASAGTYTIKVTVKDQEGATTQQSVTVNVVGVIVRNRILYVYGTPGADVVGMSQSNKGVLTVAASFLSSSVTFNASDVDRIMVSMLGGDDQLTVQNNLQKPVVAMGGAGNDTLTAGGASAILIGGPGLDTLTSNKSADVLIGGDVTSDEAALWAALAAWTSRDSYTVRSNNVRSLLTIVDDLQRDRLVGTVNPDLLIRGTGDA